MAFAHKGVKTTEAANSNVLILNLMTFALIEYVDCIRLPATYRQAPLTAVLTPLEMFSFFKKKPQEPAPAPEAPVAPVSAEVAAPVPAPTEAPAAEVQAEIVAAVTPVEQKQSWMARLKVGLSKTSSNLTTLFVGAKIDDDLYEELESALLVSDAGVDATQFLLDALKRKVKTEKLTEAEQVKLSLIHI